LLFSTLPDDDVDDDDDDDDDFSLSRSNNCHDADGLANLIKDEPALIHLWEAVRFPQLSSTFLAEVVQTSQFLTTIEQTESYQNVQKAKLMPTASRYF
jgi:hypothetical protein